MNDVLFVFIFGAMIVYIVKITTKFSEYGYDI